MRKLVDTEFKGDEDLAHFKCSYCKEYLENNSSSNIAHWLFHYMGARERSGKEAECLAVFFLSCMAMIGQCAGFVMYRFHPGSLREHICSRTGNIIHF